MMPNVTVNICRNHTVHFILTEQQVPIGPWLLFESEQEIRDKVFTWGVVTPEALEEYESGLRRWGVGSIHMELTDKQCASLARRAIGWPWNGYELLKMKAAGFYPPKRLNPR